MQLTITAIITYVVITLALALVWNLILFRDLYVGLGADALRPEPFVPLGLLAMVVEASALTFLFSRFFTQSPTLATALILTFAVGAFSITYASFVVPAKFEIVQIWKYVLLEFTFGLLHFGIVGLAFFYIFKRV